MKIEVDRESLTKILLLLLSNENLSASKAGLEQRAKNSKEAINELLFMLCLTREEAKDIYYSSNL